MRDESLVGQVIAIRQVLSRAFPFRLAVRALLDNELAVFGDQLPFHVAAEIEIAAMGDSFQLAEFALRQERKRIFDVGGAARIVAQLVLFMLTEAQSLASQAEVGVPLHPAVAPVLVPLRRALGMAKELDFHLLELARAEGEIARRD